MKYFIILSLCCLTILTCNSGNGDIGDPRDPSVSNFKVDYSFNGENFEFSGLGAASVIDTAITYTINDTTTVQYVAANTLNAFGTTVVSNQSRFGNIFFSILDFQGPGNYPLVRGDEGDQGVFYFASTLIDNDTEEVTSIITVYDEDNPTAGGQMTVTSINNGILKATFSFYAEADDANNTSGQLEGDLEIAFTQ